MHFIFVVFRTGKVWYIQNFYLHRKLHYHNGWHNLFSHQHNFKWWCHTHNGHTCIYATCLHICTCVIMYISVSLASLQPARAQYNECDCNIGEPDCQRIGECTGPVKNFTQTINSNSGILATVPVYEAGQMYYFTSECIVTMINCIAQIWPHPQFKILNVALEGNLQSSQSPCFIDTNNINS